METVLGCLGVPYGVGGGRREGLEDVPHVELAVDPSRPQALTLTLSQGEREKLPLPLEQREKLPLPLGEGRGEGSWLGALADALTRQEEYDTRTRDEHGRFLWAHTSQQSRETDARPIVSEFACRVGNTLRQACLEAGVPMARKEAWPWGKPMAACLTHDVDVVRRGKLARGVAVRDVADAARELSHGRLGQVASKASAILHTAASSRDPYWTFDAISALEREHGYRSTYFFMAGRKHPEDARYDLHEPRMDGLLRSLSESGYEIALHGSYASSDDPGMLKTLKGLLETSLGRPVSGHRNHLLRFQAPDSWLAQEAAGFAYDSTLGFSDREGFRGGHAFPFHPFDVRDNRPLQLLEIPLAVMDATIWKYRRLRGEKAREAVSTVLEQTLGVGGLATLLWHNDTFYDPEYPGVGRLYQEALEWLSAHDAHVAPCREIERWWRAREAATLSPLPEGRRGWRLETPEEIDGLVLRVTLPDATCTPRPKTESIATLLGAPVALPVDMPKGMSTRRATSRRPGPCTPRAKGGSVATVRPDGRDHLVEFGPLPAGAIADVEF